MMQWNMAGGVVQKKNISQILLTPAFKTVQDIFQVELNLSLHGLEHSWRGGFNIMFADALGPPLLTLKAF